MEVRRIRPDEMEAYRDVRLRALRLVPYAFGTTFADASSRDDDAWRASTARLCRPDIAGFVLDRGDGTFGGLVSVTIEDPAAAEVNQMWLDEDLRGGEWGAALLGACEAFAAAGGVRRLMLWAAASNERALRFYRRCGYLDTGRTEVDANAGLEVELAKDLGVIGATDG